MKKQAKTIIVGAGSAGLAAALYLSGRGFDVTVVEKEAAPGGKMREIEVDGAGINAGPTVFTMKWDFDELLSEIGVSLDDIVDYTKAQVLARHAWRDGSRLDLFADVDESANAIAAFSDQSNADGYVQFCTDAKAMFETLQRTYIDDERPSPVQFINRIGALNISQLLALKPFHSLWSALGTYFPDPRLQQLFGRYATYCGSSPYFSPSTLMLVAHVEQAGVWIANGGMHGLAKAFASQAARQGVTFRYGSGVKTINRRGDSVTGVTLENGDVLSAEHVIFNGDVSALAGGLLGAAPRGATAIAPKDRSLSALTWTVRAKVEDFPLAHHNVFFSDAYAQEFDLIFKSGRLPDLPTGYSCAQDRMDGGAVKPGKGDGGEESLLLLVNAPPVGDQRNFEESEVEACLERTQIQLAQTGLQLDLSTAAQTGKATATTPTGFNQLFPATGGALYGPLSKGAMAAFKRQGSRTAVKGLYVAGGSVHPGSGVPMAFLSGKRAAECLVSDHALMQ